MRFNGAWILGVVGVFIIAACGGRSLEVLDDGEAGTPSRAGAPSRAGSPSVAGSPASAGAPSAGAASAGAPATAGAGPTGPAPFGDANAGRQAFRSPIVACNACHGENGEGLFGPNITGSPTAGIGGWTYLQFYDSVRFAKDRNGQPLCLLMIPFMRNDLKDQSIADIYAFLMNQRSDVWNRGTYCP